jgi:hypothetical protein
MAKERIRPEVTPVEPDKRKAIETLYKIQEKVQAEAKTRDQKKEADRFCRELERERRFYQHSK